MTPYIEDSVIIIDELGTNKVKARAASITIVNPERLDQKYFVFSGEAKLVDASTKESIASIGYNVKSVSRPLLTELGKQITLSSGKVISVQDIAEALDILYKEYYILDNTPVEETIEPPAEMP